jgi:hypothetical protein
MKTVMKEPGMADKTENVAVVIRDKDTKAEYKSYDNWIDANADQTSWQQQWPNSEAVEYVRP